MKRPALKRSKKPSTPQELAGSSPVPSPDDPAFARIGQKPEKPKKAKKAKKAKEPKQPKQAKKPSRVGGGLRRVGRVLTAPVRKIAGLKGRPRLVVWGVLAAVVIVVALQLRGGRDDEQLVRDALARYEQAVTSRDFQALCDDLLATSFVRELANTGLPCEVALKGSTLNTVRNPTLEVLGVEVNGDRALARVRGTAIGEVPGESVYTMIREDDAWRILPPRRNGSPAAP